MYKIALKDVGENRVTKDITIDTNSINEVVVVAFAECKDIIGEGKGIYFSVVGEEINIKRGNVLVGSVTITKLY